MTKKQAGKRCLIKIKTHSEGNGIANRDFYVSLRPSILMLREKR
jgi:hypothetical protein